MDLLACQLRQILHPVLVQDMARQWLKEDTPSFDLAAAALSNVEPAKAAIRVKEPHAILAGRPFADAVFDQLNCKPQWHFEEGQELVPDIRVCTIVGTQCNLLLAERVVLNCIARASGVATTSRRVKKRLASTGWQGEIAGTRKTTPGFRMVEKYATLVGGIGTHRYDLSSLIMLKDNHVRLSGSIAKAIKSAKAVGGFHTKIEVECGSVEEAMEAAEFGCDVVMLDNFAVEDLGEAAEKVKRRYPNVLIEASGGINEENIARYAQDNVDVISSSMFVQGYKTINFSMKVVFD